MRLVNPLISASYRKIVQGIWVCLYAFKCQFLILFKQKLYGSCFADGFADGSPWPLSHENKEVGPFYLVWPSPKNGVYKEANWPFNLSGFKFVNQSFAVQFPKVFPSTWPIDQQEREQVKQGLVGFRTNCFVCHTMNGEGHATMGVDLKSSGIVRAFDTQQLSAFVRNPKAYMPKTKMSAFSRSMLSDGELNNIILYLQFMQTNNP